MTANAITPLRQARTARGLTQTQVARTAGLTVSQVSQLETADRPPNARTLYKVASAVGLDDLAAALRPYLGDTV